MRAQTLKIPVYIEYAEPDEYGYDQDDYGYLIYGNGHFKGFLDRDGFGPVIWRTWGRPM